jgi:uncharacterized protein YbjT (DUF2867 family)
MSQQGKVLVIGGTGRVGQAVARGLVHAGRPVRILTRDTASAQRQLGEEFEVINGNFEREEDVTRALDGCSSLHLSLPSGHHPDDLERLQHQGTARVARLAARCGIQHLTYVSGYLVSEQFAHIPAERAKINAEAAIRDSGVPFTIFRPTYFTDFLPNFVQGKRASIFGKQPHPIRFLALTDFAQMVSAAHERQATNQAIFVCGPEALTFEQALHHYIEIVCPQVKVGHTPFWMMSLMNRLFLKGAITEILQLMAATEKVGEIGDPSEANRLFGAAKTTVRQWALQQR